MGALLLTAKPGALLGRRGLAFLHVLTYSLGAGAMAWVTFVAGIVMFKSLPRQTFGRVQSRLFPIYFAWTAVSSVLQLASVRTLTEDGMPLAVLGVELTSALLNWFWVEPVTSRLMYRRYALENSPPDQRDEGAFMIEHRRF